MRNSALKINNPHQRIEARRFVKHIREIYHNQKTKAFIKKTKLIDCLETLTMRSQAEKSADYTYCLIEIKFKRENYWPQKNNQAINTKDQQNRAYSNHTKESKIARRQQHIKLVLKPEPEIQTTKNIAEIINMRV